MGLPSKFRRVALSAEKQGFFRQFKRHFVTYFQRGSTCVVTFDNMKSREAKPPRYPWGFGVLERKGYSHLGVMMSRRNDWFRHEQLWDFFDELSVTGFFDRFEDIVFYGSSMGGYGALTYSSAVPRSRAVAYVPQTSLSHEHVPWEGRYRQAFQRGDWSSERYADAAALVPNIARAQIFYDPYYKPDRQHADRLKLDNVEHFHCPFMGHRVPRFFKHIGILKPIMDECFEGSLTRQRFSELMRHRRESIVWARELLIMSMKTGQYERAEYILNWANRQNEEWAFPAIRRELREIRLRAAA